MEERLIEIENAIEASAEEHVELAELQNTSNQSLVSVWGKIKKVFAFVAYSFEKLLAEHKKEVNELIDKTEKGSLSWYLDKVKKYQAGDPLIVSHNQLVYHTIDPEKQIIKQASVYEDVTAGGQTVLKVKVVKEGDDGLYTALSDDISGANSSEVSAFEAYMRQIKFAGTKVIVESHEADEFDANIVVDLDRLLYNSDGSTIASGGSEFPVQKALENFLKNLSFDSKLYLTRLVDAIQVVEGVKDVFVGGASLKKYNELALLDTYFFASKIDSYAGHIKPSNDLSITYELY